MSVFMARRQPFCLVALSGQPPPRPVRVAPSGARVAANAPAERQERCQASPQRWPDACPRQQSTASIGDHSCPCRALAPMNRSFHEDLGDLVRLKAHCVHSLATGARSVSFRRYSPCHGRMTCRCRPGVACSHPVRVRGKFAASARGPRTGDFVGEFCRAAVAFRRDGPSSAPTLQSEALKPSGCRCSG
jgi:hypothetical protein